MMLPVVWSKKRDLDDIGSGRRIGKPVFYLVDDQITRTSEAGGHDHYHHQHSYCFLKSCHLCHKPLNLDKDVYIYGGELGFCSDECRNRQIYLDDMKKIEITTKRILASFRERRHWQAVVRGHLEHGGAAPPLFKYLEIVDDNF